MMASVRAYWLLITSVVMLCLPLCGCSTIDNEQPDDPSNTPEQAQEVWTPARNLSYQVQFTGELDLSVEAEVFELDAFDTDSSVIKELHEAGKYVICYINAGAFEDWRPDADQYPDEVIGKAYAGWSGENWLDIRQTDLLMPILETRLDLCSAKGFDAVEFDNVDGWQNDTGFGLTSSDQLVFNRQVAEAAHRRGLAAGLKNDPDHIAELEAWFDFAVAESCFSQGWCEQTQPFIDSGKPVFAIEYSSINGYCNGSKTPGINLLQKRRDLDAWRKTCQE